MDDVQTMLPAVSRRRAVSSQDYRESRRENLHHPAAPPLILTGPAARPGMAPPRPSAALIITSAIAFGSKLRLESTSPTPWRCSSLIISSIILIRRAFFALSSVMVPSAPRFHQLTHVH